MRIAVLGAGSRTGRFLIERLARDGHEVRAPSRADGVDLTQPDTLPGALAGMDTVISLVGASVNPAWRFPEQTFEAVDQDKNLALLEAARRAGVRRFVYLSVFGTYPPGVRYVEAHRAVDEALAASGLSTTSVRPTGFFGSFDALFAMARWGLAVRVGDGEAKTNPIHEADLADVIADQASEGPEVVDVGGPDVLTRNQITDLLFAAAQRTPRVIPLPLGLIRLQTALVRPFNRRIADLLVFFAHVLTHEGVAPARGTRRLADHLPGEG